MKKVIVCFLLVLVTICSVAQNDVTQFLGIPVDGTKAEMIKKLSAKGFRMSFSDKEILEGEFNGTDVNIYILTNGNKVCRIMVCDATPVDERSIQIRFNKLCDQFENNQKYSYLASAARIPDDEDISYEISVHNKRYEAIYFQKPVELQDTALLQQKLIPIIAERYSAEELANPTEKIQEDILELSSKYIIDLLSKKAVWFMISEYYGKYYITMFYDNEYNRASGEDL